MGSLKRAQDAAFNAAFGATHAGGNVLGIRHCIRHHHNEYGKEGITVRCPSCGTEQFVQVTADQIADWQGGTLSQDAFRNLNADQREAIKTGICKTCWDKI